MCEKFCTAGQAKVYNKIQRIRCVCWINKATHRHSEFAIVISFLRQKWLRECASILPSYARCLSRSISGDYQRKILPFFSKKYYSPSLSNGDSVWVLRYKNWTPSDVFVEIRTTETWVTLIISVRLQPCRTLQTSVLKQEKAQFICFEAFDFCIGLITAFCNTRI